MDENVWAIFIGIVAGAAGYLVTTFWMRPILRYLEIKQQVLSDLIFYANVISTDHLIDNMKERMWARVESNRKHSADLNACCINLPFWYRWWLKCRGEYPEGAATHLTGLSNTFEYEEAAKRIDKIKQCLRIVTDVV